MKLSTRAKYLFLFAHPDDEVVISGTMKLLVEAGAEVHAAWTTSGDKFVKREIREAELRRSMDVLALHESRTHLMRFPDLGMVAMLEEAADSATKLISEVGPDVIFANAYEGGHPDHDSVNFLAYEASARLGVTPDLFEFPLYNGTGTFVHWKWRINHFPPGGPAVLHNPLSDTAIRCKYEMMKAHASQKLYMIPARLACPRGRLTREGEPYRPCPMDRDHSVPPHPGQLNYERWFNSFMKIKFPDFRAAVLRTRRAYSLKAKMEA
ncbi:MAG: PIG-L deacetylase family protein [Desulfomonilaceae bacterium]